MPQPRWQTERAFVLVAATLGPDYFTSQTGQVADLQVPHWVPSIALGVNLPPLGRFAAPVTGSAKVTITVPYSSAAGGQVIHSSLRAFTFFGGTTIVDSAVHVLPPGQSVHTYTFEGSWVNHTHLDLSLPAARSGPYDGVLEIIASKA